MDVQVLGHVRVDGLRELRELFGAVAAVRLADDFSGGDVVLWSAADALVLTMLTNALHPSAGASDW